MTIEQTDAGHAPGEGGAQCGSGEFEHLALFYRGIAGFLDGTLPFIREGLDRGERVVAAVPGEHLRPLRERLGADADSVDLLDMAAVGRNPATIISTWRDLLRAAERDGVGIRGIGEPIWRGRTGEELVECHRHEALLNVAFEDSGEWPLLCPYDVAALDAATVAEARRTHPVLLEDGLRTESRHYQDPCDTYRELEDELPPPPARAERIDFGKNDLAALRRVAVRYARSVELDSERTSGFALAVSEVAANSIRHGGGRGTLLIWRELDAVVCEVRDSGVIEDPMAGRLLPPPELPGGRGLWLVNQMCDLVQVRSTPSGTSLRFRAEV